MYTFYVPVRKTKSKYKFCLYRTLSSGSVKKEGWEGRLSGEWEKKQKDWDTKVREWGFVPGTTTGSRRCYLKYSREEAWPPGHVVHCSLSAFLQSEAQNKRSPHGGSSFEASVKHAAPIKNTFETIAMKRSRVELFSVAQSCQTKSGWQSSSNSFYSS